MRKIEQQMNFAISNKGNWSSSNTQVSYNNNTNCSSVYLHGHQIATFDHNLKAVNCPLVVGKLTLQRAD